MTPFDEPIFLTPSPYSINDYRKDIESPNPSLKARVVDAGVNAICSIHKNTPAAWLVDQIANDGMISPEHILLDDLCRPRNQVPPDPVAPFSGGQCDAVRYNVQLTVTYNQIYGDPPAIHPATVTVNDTVWGAITGVSLSDPGVQSVLGVTSNGFARVEIACRGYGYDAIKSPTLYSPYGKSDFSIQSVELVSATRVDSQPDTCGNPPAVYPPDFPSPGDLITNPIIAITPTLSIPIRVEVRPTFKFDPTVIAPVIFVNVGGIDVHLDLGGFSLNPTFNNNTNTTSPQTNPTTPKPNANPVKNSNKNLADKTDITGILVRLNQIEKELLDCCERDRPFPPPDAAKVIITQLAVASSGLFDLPRDTFQISLQMTNQPPDKKAQAGLQSPDVLYAGWAWFGTANNMSERMPVDSQYKVFSPSRYISNTFGYTLYEGYTAIVKAYSVKPTPPPA